MSWKDEPQQASPPPSLGTAVGLQLPARAAVDQSVSANAESGTGFRISLLQGHVPYLMIVALGLLLMHLPAILAVYGFIDDYALLNMSTSGDNHDRQYLQDVYVNNGRPILGYLTQVSMSWVKHVDGLRILRALSSVLQFVLGLCIYGQLIHHRRGKLESALTTLMILSVPAFVLFVGWGGTYVAVHLALLLTFASSLLLPRRINSWSVYRGMDSVLMSSEAGTVEGSAPPVGSDGRSGPAWLAVGLAKDACRLMPSILLLIGAMLIYQPTSSFYWFWLGIGLLHAGWSVREAIGRFAMALFVYFCSGGLYFLVWKCSLRWVQNTIPGGRSSLVHSVAAIREKFTWFIHEVLPNSLYFGFFEFWNFSTAYCWIVGLFIVGVAVAGLVHLLVGQKYGVLKGRLLNHLLVLGIIPLTYFVNLVVSESFATFRTRIALSSVLALILSAAIAGLMGVVFSRPWRWIGQGIFSLVVLAMVLKGGYNIDHYIATPQNIEYSFVVANARQFDFSKYDNLLIVHNFPRIPRIFANHWYYLEFGLPTSATDPEWGGSIRTLFVSALKEHELQLGRYPSEPRIVMEADGMYFQPVPPRTMVMDMRQLILYRPMTQPFEKDLQWQMLHPTEPWGGVDSVKMWVSDRPSVSMSFRPMAPLPATTAPATLPASAESGSIGQ